ncbi:MAG: ABC transporter ATP-binding protein [Bifidobacteriaceae bacterium]|jgi:putative ABC transport system ATP-binding protein|nr:ABC transporter ATP-binding protein [Bifidobacteriaceae bacterium]
MEFEPQSPNQRARAGAADPYPVAVAGRGLTKVFGVGATEVRALDGVDVDFGSARFTAIMGPSGSGKSTLLNLLAGLDAPTAGTVRLGGAEITAMADSDLTRWRRTHVGFVFQAFNLLPMFTAEQNIKLPLELAGAKPDPAWWDTVISALALEARLSHRPAELSGGQQQRVALARAAITRPDVIFADEPTGNLDTRTGIEVLSFLRRSVRELKQTVVMVTHDPAAAAYAERVVLLADGAIAGEIIHPTKESVLGALDQLSQIATV